jgi:hypothetical protein
MSGRTSPSVRGSVRRPIGDDGRVQTAVEILLGFFLLLTLLFVFGLFVWASKKDGEEDKAVQKRLGIRPKTRLGP